MKTKTAAYTKVQNLPRQQGAALLEALIAIVIFSFGILAVSGLQAAMMKNTADATYRAEASYIVQQRMGNMMVDPIALGGTMEDLPSLRSPNARLPDGKLRIRPLSEGRLLFEVTWQVPGEALHNYQAVTSIFMARDQIL